MDGTTQVGALFVLLDGVLVATAKAELTRMWEQRLLENEGRLHVVRKARATKSANLHTPGESIEFAGVIFSHEGFCARSQSTDGGREQLRAGRCPLRDIASRLGALLWNIRVRGALDTARQGPLAHEQLMSLYQRTGVAGAAGRSYDELKLEVSDEEAAYLNVMEKARVEAAKVPWPPERGGRAPVLAIASTHRLPPLLLPVWYPAQPRAILRDSGRLSCIAGPSSTYGIPRRGNDSTDGLTGVRVAHPDSEQGRLGRTKPYPTGRPCVRI